MHTAGAAFLYKPRTLPWRQRGFRVCDPDGHTLDISETMAVSVQRQAAAGQTLEQISATSGFARAEVPRMVAGAAART